jgi:23S rRNA (adenine2503-C2)-methyltransferase
MKINLKQLSKDELALFIVKLGEKPYRVGQIISWIYKMHAVSFDEMTNLSKELREKLKGKSVISNLTIIDKIMDSDGTVKFLFGLHDGESVESVLIPNIHGKGKYTLCISSQVGCALKCAFCRTGRLGLKRNLRAYEIIDQVISLERYLKENSKSDNTMHDITNIVLMGMGEPLNNFREVNEALWKLITLMKYSKRRITLSTAGIVSKIAELGKTGPGVNLAVSLNATTDKVRSTIMPVNKKYPIKKLIDACREYPLSPARKLTFEYVLIKGLNDTDEDALRLIKLLKGIKAKVNLIPYNVSDDALFKKPSSNRVHRFQEILINGKVPVTIRVSKGSDISAACGQLKATYGSL